MKYFSLTAFGGIGGYIAGSKKLVDTLRRHSAAHIYGYCQSIFLRHTYALELPLVTFPTALLCLHPLLPFYLRE